VTLEAAALGVEPPPGTISFGPSENGGERPTAGGDEAAPANHAAPGVGPPVEPRNANATRAMRFQTMVRPHLDAAYSLASYLVRDPITAEDVTQEAFMRAYRGLDSLRGPTAKPWLMAIVRNACIDYHRQNHGWDEQVADGPYDAINAVADPDAGSPEDAAIRQSDVAILRQAIKALPRHLREALVLRELEEFSYREIAEITAAPIGTVMSRLARARAELSVTWRRIEN